MLARPLTEARLDAITNADFQTLAARIPPEDRCTFRGVFPTRAQWLRFVRDETPDRNARDAQGNLILPHPLVARGFSAVEFREDNGDLYGGAMLHTTGTVVRISCWVTPIDGQSLDAVRELLAEAEARGATAVEGVVANERLRERLAQYPQVTLTHRWRLRVDL